MKKRAREESVPLPQIYRREMTKVYVPSFQNLKSSLYRSRLQRFPTLPQTREEIDFSGEWTQTAREEDFLLVDTGQNDQNRLVAFATVGNLEKLCEAETIYIYDVIKGEQAVTDLEAVQLDAGSQPPRRRRKYITVDQRLKLLKEAYVGGEKTIDRYIVGVAYNLSSFV